MINLKNKVGLIVGVANENSIAWGCAKKIHDYQGAVALTYANEKTKQHTNNLAEILESEIYLPCNVENSSEILQLFEAIKHKWGKLDFLIHSIAFAPREDLQGKVIDCSAAGFAKAMDISCYSLIALSKMAAPLMKNGGSILTISYYGSQKVVKNYNVMGIAKAALESTSRYLAYELGENNIRVNVLSPGPIVTRAASGILEFDGLLNEAIKKSPLKRGIDIYNVGDMAAFMISDLSQNITGQIFYIDAGSSIVS